MAAETFEQFLARTGMPYNDTGWTAYVGSGQSDASQRDVGEAQARQSQGLSTGGGYGATAQTGANPGYATDAYGAGPGGNTVTLNPAQVAAANAPYQAGYPPGYLGGQNGDQPTLGWGNEPHRALPGYGGNGTNMDLVGHGYLSGYGDQGGYDPYGDRAAAGGQGGWDRYGAQGGYPQGNYSGWGNNEPGWNGNGGYPQGNYSGWGNNEPGWNGNGGYPQSPGYPQRYDGGAARYAPNPGNPDQMQYQPYRAQPSVQRPQVPLANQMAPWVWDSISPVGQQLAYGAVEQTGQNANEYQRQMDAARPQGRAPRMTTTRYGQPQNLLGGGY